MFRTIKDFTERWKYESGATRKVFGALTDESLNFEEAPGHRTLGRMAWHIILSIPEMAARTGLTIDGPRESDPIPKTAGEICKSYDKVASALLKQIETGWTDKTLLVEDDMYGEKWRRGISLTVIVLHEIHHRAQMTVLMRQASLKVPGVYGPSKEEWVNYKATPPEI
jgi:uncharacterized damage-inducible protein DinB